MIQRLTFLGVALCMAFVILLGFFSPGSDVIPMSMRRFTVGLLVALAAIWLLARWRLNWQWHRMPPESVLPLWVGAIGLSILTNPDTWRRSIEAVWYVSLYVALGYMLIDVLVNSRRIRQAFAPAILFTGLLNLIFIYMQVFESISPPFRMPLRNAVGMFGNPNLLGTFLIFVIAFALEWFMQSNRTGRWFAGAYLLLNGVALALTFSRGSWVGMVIGLGIWALLWLYEHNLYSWQALKNWWSTRSQRMQRTLMALGGSMILLGVAMVYVLIASLSMGGRSLSLRTYLWDAGLQMTTESPLTGHGLFTYGFHLARFDSIPPGSPHGHAHSLPLNILAEIGILGLLAFVLSIVVFAWYAWKYRDVALQPTSKWPYQRAAVVAIVGFLGQHIIDVTGNYPPLALMTLCVVVLAIAPVASKKPIASSSLNAVKTGSVAVIWLSVAIVAFWNLNVYETYVNVLARVQTSESYSSPMLQEAAAELDPVIAADPYQPAYIANQAYLYGMAAHYDPGNTDALSAGIEALERYTTLEPTHSVGWANLAGLYWQAEQPDRALEAVNQAIELAPEWDFYKRMSEIYTGDLPDAETVVPPESRRPAGGWYSVHMIRMHLSPMYLPQVGYGADRNPLDIRWNASPEDTTRDDATTEEADTADD